MKVNVTKGSKVDGIFTSYLGRNFVLLSLSIHITSLLDNVKKLSGEDLCGSSFRSLACFTFLGAPVLI